MDAAESVVNGEDSVDGSDPQNLVYENGVLLSGPLDSFIQHLVPTASYFPDRSYIFAFVLSSRLFLMPHQLMNQVCQTCILQQNLKSENVTVESLGKFGPHMIRLLGEWTDNFPYDFRDEHMSKCLKDMTQLLVNIYPELRRDVGILMHNLFSKISALHKYEDLLMKINAEAAHRLMPTTDIGEVCSSPLVLSQQLTHIELERLSMIGPEEFLQSFAVEKKLGGATKDTWRTKNIDFYIQWYNRLSSFVATEICVQLKKRNRVRMIEYFVNVAKECINIGNFNSLMAIIGGLNMGCVQRLKKTWAKVNKEKLEILEHQTNPANNFSSYRSSLKAAVWRAEGASDDRERIIIPFFSIFVKDIYVLNEGCLNRLPSGHINFEKFWHLAKQINEFISWKQLECPFDRCSIVLNYLLTNVVLTDNSLALASYECEPPDSSYEKHHYKQLKEEATPST